MDRYKNSCRICIKEDGIKIPIFSEEGHYRGVVAKMKDCLNIPLYPNDPLPKQICNSCFYKLELAAEVKEICQRSNAIFTHHLLSQRGNASAREYLNLVQDRPQHMPPPQQGQKRKLPDGNTSQQYDSESQRKRPNLERQSHPPNLRDEAIIPTPEQIVESGGPFYLCELCDKGFLYKHSLSLHKHQIHGLQLIQSETQPQQTLKDIPNYLISSVVPPEQCSPQMPQLIPETIPSIKPIENTPQVVPTETSHNSSTVEVSTPSTPITTNLSSQLENSKTTSTESRRLIKRNPVSTNSDLTCEKCHEIFSNRGTLVIHKIRKHNYKTERTKAMKSNNSQKHSARIALRQSSPKKTTKAAPVNKTSSPSDKKKASTSKTTVTPKKLTTSPEAKSPSKTIDTASARIKNAQIKSPQTKISSVESLNNLPVENPTEICTSVSSNHNDQDKYECETCFRVLRGWNKFVEHCNSIHNFTPTPPEPASTSTQNIPTPDKENISTVIDIPTLDKVFLSPDSENKICCLICHTKYKNKFSLNIHYRKIHSKYNCSDCTELFDTKDDLDNHIVTHDIEAELELHLTSKFDAGPSTIPDLLSLPKSKNVETKPHAINKFECFYCYATYTQKTKLMYHQLQKHKLHTCNQCNNGFTTKENLEYHKFHLHGNDQNKDLNHSMIQSTNTDDVMCKSCKVTFPLRSSLYLHVKMIHKMIPCYLCLNNFTKDSIEEHKKQCLDPNLVCIKCDKVFKDAQQIGRHMTLKHSKNSTKSSTSIEENRETEETAHTKLKSGRINNKVLPCLYCKEPFKQHATLWTHVKNNHPANPHYQCDSCEHVFFSQSGLIKHKQRHCSKNKSLETQVDEKEDNEEVQMDEKEEDNNKIDDGHQQSHVRTEFEDMSCPVCKKEFSSTWQNLNRHIKEVHNPVSYRQCMYCIKIFIDIQEWKLHEKKHIITLPDNTRKIQQIGTIPMKSEFRSIVYKTKNNSQVGKEINSDNCLEEKEKDNTPNDRSLKPTSLDLAGTALNVSAKKRISSGNGSESNKTSVKDNTLILEKMPRRDSIDSTKSTKGKATCKYCDVEFETFTELLTHIESLHPTELYLKCENCDNIYYDFSTLSKHNSQAHATLSLACSFCSRTFTRENNRTNHEKACSQRQMESSSDDDDEDDTSSDSSSSSPKLKRSKQSHSSAKSSVPPCQFCNMQLKTPELLLEHISQHARNAI